MSECKYYSYSSSFWSNDYRCALKKRLDGTESISYDDKKSFCCDTWESDREESCPFLRREKNNTRCFLTSACVRSRGLPDDCYELRTLRKFRDEYMRSFPEGEAEIAKYYSIAPPIVKAIDSRADAKQIWAEVYNDLVLHSIAEINADRFEEAYNYYKEYTLSLEKRFLSKE